MDQMKTEARLRALEGAMAAAVRDYKADLMADEDLDVIHAQRIKEMKAEAMRRQEQARKGHDSYTEVEEKKFLEEVTTTKHVVCHFFHPDFVRCKVVDKHLSNVCRKYTDTKFIKVNATEAPFFITKLQ